MKELNGKTAIITGASKGIGEATARHMASMGVNVVLAARSERSVVKLPGPAINGKAKGKTDAVTAL